MNPVPAWGSILYNLYGILRPKIDSAFEDVLELRVNISPGIRSKASDSQNHLRDFLSAESSRDSTFPRALSKIVSERTISRWMKGAPRDPALAKRWLAFLRDHREAIAAMDFFTVPTITFSALYCFFVISHDRRRILHLKG
jgi:hypothetical protein